MDSNPIRPTVPPPVVPEVPKPEAPKAVITSALPDEPTEEEQAQRRDKKDGFKSILSTLAILIIAPLIALSLTAFVFQSYEVDGPSMETTLQNHDRLIVYKLPKTLARIAHSSYVPKRGEIVIFSRTDSLEFGTNDSRQLIKRVMALPGERVVVKDGILKVYNKEHPEGFRPDDAPYGKVIVTTPGDIDLTVPQDYIYVCGDNRTNSLDSRTFGPVATKDLVGKLVLRLYPFNKSQKF